MNKIFLVNIGANTSDGSRARSPLFKNGRFIYVPFSYKRRGNDGRRDYPSVTRPFIRAMHGRSTHCDPDWDNYTYGDYCLNRRARALASAGFGDILLFWGLLWRSTAKSWDGFTGEKGWYLLGAFRIHEVLVQRQRPTDASTPDNRTRAAQNVHFYRGILDTGNRVFIGSRRYSKRFPKAVPFYTEDSRLLFDTVRTRDGRHLRIHSRPRWISSTRPCRAVWDFCKPAQRLRAKMVRDAILQHTDYDLFRDVL
jgi:hypothetical protein